MPSLREQLDDTLVLLMPYRDYRFMILSEMREDSEGEDGAFYSQWAEILYPLQRNQIIPRVSQNLEAANSDEDAKGDVITYNTFKSRYEIKLMPLKRSSFVQGIDDVLGTLRDTRGYEAHAASIEEGLKRWSI